MIYHKYESSDRTTIINEIYDDELITYCGDCAKEIPHKRVGSKIIFDIATIEKWLEPTEGNNE